MFKVICPACGESREVAAKKPWMKGEPPFVKICKVCCQSGKVKSDDHKKKLSNSLKKLQTDEVLQKKSQFMLDHPEYWLGKLKQGGAEEHSVGKKHSEETKRKISENVKKAKQKDQK